jgi:hypothetical protein
MEPAAAVAPAEAAAPAEAEQEASQAPTKPAEQQRHQRRLPLPSVLPPLPSVLVALFIGAATTVGQALVTRIRHELVSAKRDRALARLRMDWANLVRTRFNVLACTGEGEATEWTNELLQALWGPAVAPVLAVHIPPLVDLALAQLVSNAQLLPSWVTKLQLVKLELGGRAPKLTRVRLPHTVANGTCAPGDLTIDFEVDVDLQTEIVIAVTLETSMSRLVSRLTGHAHAASVELHVSGVRQRMLMRLRSRPEHAVFYLGLLKFTGKPAADVRLLAHDVGGVKISLPLSRFPGADMITAYITTRLTREFMGWADHRFLPLDMAPLVSLITRPADAGGASIPTSGRLRMQLVEARGLTERHGPQLGLRSPSGMAVADGPPLHDDCDDAEPALARSSSASPSGAVRRQRSTDGGGSVHAARGSRPFARVRYAMGSRVVCSGVAGAPADGDGRAAWLPHEGRLSLNMVGPCDFITLTLRRRKGLGGAVGDAHFKFIWAENGSSIYYSLADGTPTLLRAAFCQPGEMRRAAAGVPFSGTDGYADFWLPLLPRGGAPLDGSPCPEIRVQLSVEWFGSVRTHSPAEMRAALVLQRFVRGWKARRRLVQERSLVPAASAGAPLQLVVTLQGAHGLPLKSGYAASLTLQPGAGPADAALLEVIRAAPALDAPACARESEEPAWGVSLVVPLPAARLAAFAAAAPTLLLTVLRKSIPVAVGTVHMPPEVLAERGRCRRLRVALEPTEHCAVLHLRAAHKLRARHLPSGGVGEGDGGGGDERDVLSAVVYVCVVHQTDIKPAAAEEGSPASPTQRQLNAELAAVDCSLPDFVAAGVEIVDLPASRARK